VVGLIEYNLSKELYDPVTQKRVYTAFRTITRRVNHFLASNEELLRQYLVNEFIETPIGTDDYGMVGIVDVEIVENELIGLKDYKKIKMKLNDKMIVFFIVFSIV